LFPFSSRRCSAAWMWTGRAGSTAGLVSLMSGSSGLGVVARGAGGLLAAAGGGCRCQAAGDRLLQRLELGLEHRAACVVCGDTTPERKPHPAPLLHACALIGIPPGQCAYLGDAERDIQAARAAGMPALVARWGYLGEADEPGTWAADALLEHPLALLDWLASDAGLGARA